MSTAWSRNALIAAVAAVVGSLVVGCTTSGPPSASGPTRDAPPEAASPALSFTPGFDLPDGYAGTALYLLAGPHPLSQDLYRLTVGESEPRRLTHNPPDRGVSHVAASAERIVLADARTGRDELVIFDTDATRPLAGEPPDSRGFGPDLRPDGRLLHVRRSAGAEMDAGPLFEAVIRDSVEARAGQVIYQESRNLLAVWGPDDSVAVVTLPSRDNPAGEAEIILVDPATGRVQPLTSAPGWSSPYLVAHPESHYLVVTDPRSGNAGVIDTVVDEWQALPAGWTGLCFDPFGERVLVTRDSALGLVSPTAPDRVRQVAPATDHPVGMCAWVDAE